MSDNPKPNANQAPEDESEELKPSELEKISGGVPIEGIKGESTDKDHGNWIQLGSYNS